MKKNISGFDYLRQKAMRSGTLLSIHFDITYRCPQDCIHCYIDKRRKKELSLEEIKKILIDARSLNTLFVTFSGGEVFARRDFGKIIEMTNRIGFSIKLITSGYLIGKKEEEHLKKNRVISVGVSLHSIKPEIHDTITTIKGSCEKTMRAIKMLNEAGIPVVVKSMVMRQNYEYYIELLKWVLSMGENVVPQYDMVVTPTMEHRNNVREMNLSFEEKKAIFREIRKIEKKPILRYSDLEFDKKRGKAWKSITCYAGITGIYIDPEGKVYPCVEWQTLLGDLRKESLVDIWHHSQALKEVQSLRVSDYKKCSECKFLYSCSMCPGLNLRDTGDIFTPSNLACDRARMYYENE